MCSDYEELEWLGTMWQALGIFLKFHCNHLNIYVLSGNSYVTKVLDMKANNGMDQQFWEMLKVQL
jgi:hypothetical protein